MSKYVLFFKVMGWIMLIMVVAIGTSFAVATLVFMLLLDFSLLNLFTACVGILIILVGANECVERIKTKLFIEPKPEQVLS